MVTFRLHRQGVIFIIIGSILAAVLIFIGGCVFGMRRRPALPSLPATARAGSAPAAVTATAPKQPEGELLAVRVGVFDSEEEAKALAQKLSARKLEAAILPLTTTGGVQLYTVQVGHYTTRAAASAAAAALADEHGLKPAVVAAGQ
jgi:cell division septation protein DedD